MNWANLMSSLNDPLAVAAWIARIDDVLQIEAISAQWQHDAKLTMTAPAMSIVPRGSRIPGLRTVLVAFLLAAPVGFVFFLFVKHRQYYGRKCLRHNGIDS